MLDPAPEQHIFKQPALRTYLLGLDLLATQKHCKKEHQAGGSGKCYKDLADSKDGPVTAQEQLPLPSPDKGKGDSQATSGHSSRKDRHYHSAWVDTPSHVVQR
ncbi:UNVERIFIED_CONTAM: hypothetical protein K2H54_024544 [Gekko kuhli]